jgi:hypothetical protein
VQINNPADIPGKVFLEFQDKASCMAALDTMTYWIKFNTFKVVGSCYEK